MSQRLRGDGKVFKGAKFVADIRYEIQITSRYKTTRTIDSEHRVLLGRDIRLRITPAGALADFIGEKLTLHFEHSRRLDFVVESLAGTCAASGDLYASGRLPILGTPRKQRNLFAFGLS